MIVMNLKPILGKLGISARMGSLESTIHLPACFWMECGRRKLENLEKTSIKTYNRVFF